MDCMKYGLLALLTLAVVASGVGVTWAKFESRRQFMALEQLRQAQDRVNIRWGQLKLEQSALAAHTRVESLARDRLGMRKPEPDKIEVVSIGVATAGFGSFPERSRSVP